MSVLIIFNFVFLLITLFSLVVVLFDRFSWKQYKDRDTQDYFVGLSYELLPIMLIIMVVRTYIFEPFIIPSESMYPQLTEGNIIAVSKTSYGLKFPFTNQNIVTLNHPQRGDVAVFKYPLDPNTYFIKRVIGIPGDKLTWYGDDLFINGEKVVREKTIPSGAQKHQLGDQYYWEFLKDKKYQIRKVNHDEAQKFNETSPFVILRMSDSNWQDLDRKFQKLEIKVPEGNYFMMGDNRDFSMDSRTWGFVSEGLLVGKASRIVFHVSTNEPIWKFWKKFTFSKNLVIQ